MAGEVERQPRIPTNTETNTTKKRGDRRSRDARKQRKNGKGGKLLADGSLHYNAFDSHGPTALDRCDPNFVDEDLELELQPVEDELHAALALALVAQNVWPTREGADGREDQPPDEPSAGIHQQTPERPACDGCHAVRMRACMACCLGTAGGRDHRASS